MQGEPDSSTWSSSVSERFRPFAPGAPPPGAPPPEPHPPEPRPPEPRPPEPRPPEPLGQSPSRGHREKRVGWGPCLAPVTAGSPASRLSDIFSQMMSTRRSKVKLMVSRYTGDAPSLPLGQSRTSPARRNISSTGGFRFISSFEYDWILLINGPGSGLDQVWIGSGYRCGLDLDQVWIRCGSGLDQVWIGSESGLNRLWIGSGSGLNRVLIGSGSGVDQVWIQVWIRSGSGVDRVWIRCGSGLDQVWIRFGSGLDQVWIGSGSGLDRAWIGSGSGLDQVWIGPGSGLDQVWIRSGSGVDQVWIRCGSGLDRVWIGCGSGLDQVWIGSHPPADLRHFKHCVGTDDLPEGRARSDLQGASCRPRGQEVALLPCEGGEQKVSQVTVHVRPGSTNSVSHNPPFQNPAPPPPGPRLLTQICSLILLSLR
ncbi:hypothetical protein EYF80_047105 [Liparis tanakae]|uniref:Uncharacterized protein n=1 Tax=Liparis tanakae TaxID=230148 RepID=A0A4Z2FQS9_9TELE|nr:hypothetical protein EYF80_047105 [Liparis tanakae]